MGRSFPNPLVGAIVVNRGKIVGTGYHKGPGSPHAEIEAIAEAGELARGATLYLNLEPCCHFGKTPPCTDAIIKAGISRVVFSILDPFDMVRGKGAGILRARGVDVSVGVCARDALELNLAYVHRCLTGRALVVLKLASTLDGNLTAHGHERLTGEEAGKRVHTLRAWTEAIAVGIGTLLEDRPILDRRLFNDDLPPPIRMIFDTTLRFPCDHPWLNRKERVILYCLRSADRRKWRLLEEAGAEVVGLDEKDGVIDLSSWIGDIGDRGITSVLVEGGGKVASSFIREGCFERLVLFYAPILSGRREVPWFQDTVSPLWLNRGELEIVRVERFGEDLMAVYDRRNINRYWDIVTVEKELVHWIG
jgi:diaminohydroxyphosphoribosylaminopyrimidine deaminase/5-amino-6-(5-phosphoribosylamino)uracil reductase